MASPSEHAPDKHDLRLATWLSAALAAVAVVSSAVGVFFPVIFRDPAMTVGNARGTALVILVVAVPTLVVSMILAARGSLAARIVWLGALAYVLYNSVFFVFAMTFNVLFLVYVAMFSLALWSLVALLAGQRGDIEHTIHFAELARTHAAEEDGYLRFFTSWNLAVAKQMQGRLGEAEEALTELAADPWATGLNRYFAVRTYYTLGQVCSAALRRP